MIDPEDEFEPLFDYSRVQPTIFECVDSDDGEDSRPIGRPFGEKRKRSSGEVVDTKGEQKKSDDLAGAKVVGGAKKNEEDEWLPPPPPNAPDSGTTFVEEKTLQELRLKKQELASFVKTSEDVMREAMESAKKKHQCLEETVLILDDEEPLKPVVEREKIIVSLQGESGTKKYRIFMDEDFGRLFSAYAKSSMLQLEDLVFCFDGGKIGAAETPGSLSMEDDDIIEVHLKRHRPG